jgi:hypothetical protein
MLFKHNISSLPFKVWLWQERENKVLFAFTLIVMLLSFAWLKYIYPYPNFISPESYNYLESATNNDLINMWPVGYSKFLRMVSVFTRSHLALVIFQYILLIAAVLYFLFTLRYFVSPGKWLFRITLAISVLNPLLPHIANFVSSDALFASLSMIWFTQLWWILYQPTKILLLVHAFILLGAFTVRLTAVYYPIISILIIFFSHMPASKIKVGIAAIVILFLVLIGRTQYEYLIRANIIQYAAFGKWQMATNAIIGYTYADPIPAKQAPSPFRELHSIVNQYLDSLRHLPKSPSKRPGGNYMWNLKSPLLQYANKHKGEKGISFEQEAKLGVLYANYGKWLIKRQPSAFINHYVWPNLLKYYSPPATFMGFYNSGKGPTNPVVTTWFNWKNYQLGGGFNNRTIGIMRILPNLLAIINPSFLIMVLFFISFSGLKQCSRINKKFFGFLLLVWFANVVISVLSVPIELRYQVFPTVITVTFCLLLLSWIVQSLQSTQSERQQQTTALKQSYTIHS